MQRDWQNIEERYDEIKGFMPANMANFKSSSLNAQQKQKLRQLYFAVTDKKLTEGCGNCLFDGFVVIGIALKNENKQKTNNMDKQEFKMYPKKMVTQHGSDPLTSDNCTDEKALSVLRRSSNPKAVLDKFFASFPDNWEELMKQKPKKGAKDGAADDATGKGKSDPVKIKEAEDAKKAFLNAKDEDELIELCKEAKVKKKDWTGKTHGQLVAILMTKFNAEEQE